MKTCTLCRETKPLIDFNKGQARCRPCSRDYQKKWADQNRQRTRVYGQRAYRKLTDEQKAAKYAAAEERRYLKLYGLTEADYNRLLEQQGRVCNICQIPGRTGRWNKLVVDHCHETGKVRGLLCSGCNVAIAALGDNEMGLRRALNHLLNRPI